MQNVYFPFQFNIKEVRKIIASAHQINFHSTLSMEMYLELEGAPAPRYLLLETHLLGLWRVYINLFVFEMVHYKIT